MFRGYLQLGGVTIINSERTYQYVRNNLPQFPLKDCDDCTTALHEALGAAPYESPLVDDAPWVEEFNPATQRFYGFYPLELTGSLDDTTRAEVVEGILDGGYVGAPRAAVREMRYRGLMIAQDRLALHAGMTWLKSALHPAPCDAHGGSCSGATACMYAACPEVTLCYEDYHGQPDEIAPIGQVSPTTPFTYLFNEGGLTTARFLIPVTDGFAFQWGSRRTDGSGTYYEQKGPIVSRRTNFLMNPTFRQSTSLWTPSGQGVLSRALSGGVDNGQYASMAPVHPSTRKYSWIPEPSFENFAQPDGAGWSSNGLGGLVRVEDAASPQGNHHAAATYDPDGDGTLWLAGTVLPEPAGTTGRLVSFWIGRQTHNVTVQLRAADGTILNQQNLLPGNMTLEWQRVWFTYLGTPAKPITEIRIIQTTPATDPLPLRVDGFLIEQATVAGGQPSEYWDGSSTDTRQADYAWTGAQHLSTSTESHDGVVEHTNVLLNPSIEVAEAGATVVRTNIALQPTPVGTTGWYSNDSAIATVAYDPTGGRRAGTGAKAATTVTSTSLMAMSMYDLGSTGGATGRPAVTAFKKYRLSVYVKTQAVGTQARMFYSPADEAGALVGATVYGGYMNVPAGEWVRVDMLSNSIPNGATRLIVSVNVAVPAGGQPLAAGVKTWATDALFEETADATASPMKDWFSGALPDALGFDYSWTGTANASTSTAKAQVATIRTNYLTNPQMLNSTFGWTVDSAVTQTAGGGGTRLDVIADPNGRAMIFSTDQAPAAANQAWTGYLSVKAVAGFTGGTVILRVYSYGDGLILAESSPAAIAPGQTVSLRTLNFRNYTTAATTGVRLLLYAAPTAEGGPVPGAQFELNNAMLERSNYQSNLQVFTGANSPKGDFTYSWAGTPNQSYSYEQGVAANRWTAATPSSVAVGTMSWEWANAPGTVSLRQTPTYYSQGSGFTDIANSISNPPGLVSGKWYTLGAMFYKPAATGTARGAIMQTATPAGAYDKQVTARDIPGPQDLRLTFQVPPNNGQFYVRLFHGGQSGEPAIWWDSLTLVEVPDAAHPYTGPLFNGDTPPTAAVNYQWVDGDPLKGSAATVVTTDRYELRSADTPTTFGNIIASFYLRSVPDAGIAHVQAEIRSVSDDTLLGTAQFDPTAEWARYSLTSSFGRNVYLKFIGTRGQVDIDHVMIETGTTLWPYFDGHIHPGDPGRHGQATPYAPQYSVYWTGAADASTSQMLWTAGLDPDNPNQQILTLDEVCDEEWQIVLEAIAGGIADGTLQWHTRPAIPATVQAIPYERNFHDVSTTSGPTVIQEFSFTNGAAVEVEFTIVAGTPFAYGATEDLLDRVPMAELPITDFTDIACALPDDSPILDPGCPPVPAAPRPPVIPNVCIEDLSQWKRVSYQVPAEKVSGWSQMLPTILLTTKAQDVRQVRVRFTPNPFDWPVEASSRVNLVRNPQAAINTTYFYAATGGTGAASTLTRATATPPPGLVGMIRLTYTTAASSGATYLEVRNGSPDSMPLLDPGQPYTYSAWVRGSWTGNTFLTLSWLNAASGVISSVTSTATSLGTGWTRLNISGVAPVGTVRAVLGVRRDTPPAVGAYIETTGLVLEPGDQVLPYFDGDTPAANGWHYLWSGAPHLSESYGTDSSIDPCGYCSEFILSYLPANSELTVDGLTKTAFAQIGGAAPKPASHLLYGTDGTPMSWSSLSCGISYVMTVDVPMTAVTEDLSVSLSLTAQE